MFSAIALLFIACEKDKQEANTKDQQAPVEFKIEQSNFDFKTQVPECDDDAIWSHVVFSIKDADGNTSVYNSTINYIGEEYLTQVIKLDPGTYLLTSFMVYDTEGNIIRAAPMSSSIYHNLMTYQLDLEFIVEPFIKKQVPIDVLCYEELAYDEFGFTWFEFNDVRIEYQCIFGDICVDDYEPYEESLYAGQANGIQFDIPAIFEIHVYKEGVQDALKVFSNAEWLGEGQCLEVYWPNRIDEEGEVFNFELWVLLPTFSGFEYQLIDTWTFHDDEGATAGEDGVVDFVVGNCLLNPADYQYEYIWYGPLHDPILEIQFDEPNNHNMNITSDRNSYFTINGGNENGKIKKYDRDFNHITTYNIGIDGRGLCYNSSDGLFYASVFNGSIVKITDLANGSWEMLYEEKMQNPQASFSLSADGSKFYDFFRGKLMVWDLATGTLIETITGLSFGNGNMRGHADITVDPDFVYTWNAQQGKVFIHDHAGVLLQTMTLIHGNYGHSLSFVNGYLFVSEKEHEDSREGTGTWYGYNIRKRHSKSLLMKSSQEVQTDILNSDTDTTMD